MAQNKTQATQVSVSEFINNVPDETRRDDANTVCGIFEEITGEAPVMWGPTIIGFGQYTYKCGNRDETSCKTGFSPRKAELVLYIGASDESQAQRLAKLGPHRAGKGCLYIKKLEKVDVSILRDMIKAKWDDMNAKYG